MSRNVIIAAVVGLLVAGGIVFWVVAGGGDDSETVNSTESASESAGSEEAASGDGVQFSPLNTVESDFTATVATETDQGNYNGSIEYDSEGFWRYVGSAEGQEAEIIVTPDAYYSNTGGQWIKIPATSNSELGFDLEAYEVTEEELTDFRDILDYKGKADCPAGTCDLWEATEYQGNDMLQFYVDSSNRINQLVSDSESGKITIVYTYEDVSITVPTDVQEIPGI